MTRKPRSRRWLSRWRETRTALHYWEMTGPPLGGPICPRIPARVDLVGPVAFLDLNYVFSDKWRYGKRDIVGQLARCSGAPAPVGTAVAHLCLKLRSGY